MDIKLYDHNKEAYEKVRKHFENSNKTCVIHPTGTGKSFISLKFLFDNKDKKCLFMAPTDAIVQQIKTHIEDLGLTLDDFPNLEFCLYASGEKVKNNKYDYIVFDEFHRIGADVWGSNVNELLENNKDAKILGVSATPIRYLDDNRDMSKEIFNGDVASHLTLAEAIVKKILPTPNYIGSIISLQSDIDKIQKQIDNYVNKEEAKEYQKILDKAKKMLENSDGLDVIFNKHIQNKNGKFIVFCRNYDHMIEMEEKCKDWFKKVNPNIEISDVYANRGKEINKSSIKTFEENNNDSIKLLFSIEMLNEGLHVKDIDGVIMFRPTESPIIYLQQLGRALSVGHNKHPLVFDIVNNFSSLDYIRNLKIEVEKLINDILIENPDYDDADELYEILDTFNIIEQNQNIIRILERLENETFFSWDSWYELAKAYYEHQGDLLVPHNFRTLNGYKYDENGVNLGKWISNQRNAKKGYADYVLSEDKIKKLEEIEMIWEPYEYQFDKFFELATSYFNYYGNLKVPGKFKTINGYKYDENGDNLGQWIARLRKEKKYNYEQKLSEDKIKKLENIGMVWNLREYQWNTMYELSKAYYNYYGNLLISTDYKTINGYEYDENGLCLGIWINNQRRKKRNNNLNEEKKIKLENIGMSWNHKESKWFVKYKEAKEYYDEHGNLLVPEGYITSTGFRLDSWLARQRKKCENKTISKEKIELLEAIGMQIKKIDKMKEWLKKYKEAKEYYDENGNLKVTQRYVTSTGFKLGTWIKNCKCAYQGKGNNMITYEYIRLLESLDIKWFDDKKDDELQKEEITEKNKLIKQREILNRFYSLLCKYDETELPSKEELNKKFIKQLNREE